jgi:hypothetical protein
MSAGRFPELECVGKPRVARVVRITRRCGRNRSAIGKHFEDAGVAYIGLAATILAASRSARARQSGRRRHPGCTAEFRRRRRPGPRDAYFNLDPALTVLRDLSTLWLEDKGGYD